MIVQEVWKCEFKLWYLLIWPKFSHYIPLSRMLEKPFHTLIFQIYEGKWLTERGPPLSDPSRTRRKTRIIIQQKILNNAFQTWMLYICKGENNWSIIANHMISSFCIAKLSPKAECDLSSGNYTNVCSRPWWIWYRD